MFILCGILSWVWLAVSEVHKEAPYRNLWQLPALPRLSSALSRVLLHCTQGCWLSSHVILLLGNLGVRLSSECDILFFSVKAKITLAMQANCQDSKVRNRRETQSNLTTQRCPSFFLYICLYTQRYSGRYLIRGSMFFFKVLIHSFANFHDKHFHLADFELPTR